ncbi:RAD52 DNA repair protein [Mycena belliarum]|uniref:RAD52 DNA repair protein n=1 Tax=Mycena belliarum TaxID=1033014 RepID=A0AAD6UIB4_9AGAR|nr:RAD52 DNA repair protein [Mycena belliae]
MAGPLSGHLLNSYEASGSNQSICTDGLISFNPTMHGSFSPNMHSTQQQQQSFSFSNPSMASTSMSESTYDRVNRLQAKLNQKLGPEFISQRPGPGGGPKLTYAEGWKVINVANEVFGFHGWSSNIVSLTTDYMDYNEETRRYNVGVSAVMRVTLREGVFHEDVGYGMIENAKAKGTALDKCKKEAITDGLKRTLRTFGNVMGNCLYDKQYTAEIVKIKVQPTKLDKGELYRAPEFSEKPPAAASTSGPRPINATSTPVRAPTTPAPVHAPAPAPQQPRWQAQPQQPPARPISSVPRHLQPSGLQTPITTPAHAPERRVAFAPQVKAEPTPLPAPKIPPTALEDDTDAGDDSFAGLSDDDAFLASVDMGEGDLGQPIDFEEGAGSSTISSAIEAKAPVVAPPALQQQALSGAGQGARQQGPMNPPPNPPLQQKAYVGTTSTMARGGPAALPRLADASSSTSSSSRPPIVAAGARSAQGGPSASGSGSSTRSGPSNGAQYQNQNVKPQASALVSSASPSAAPPQPAKRPSTPSVGGFHFPPGMQNPLLPQNASTSRPPAPHGVKRGADAMMGSSVRSGAGLGLSNIGGGPGGGARQPLGTLAVDGQPYQQGVPDAKRIRR